MPVKRVFYSSCSSIFMHTVNLSELAVLSLQESYSLLVLMYSIPAMSQPNRSVNWAFVGIVSYANCLITTNGNLSRVFCMDLVAWISPIWLRCKRLNFISICLYPLIVRCIMCSTLLWYTTTLVMTCCEQFSCRNV